MSTTIIETFCELKSVQLHHTLHELPLKQGEKLRYYRVRTPHKVGWELLWKTIMAFWNNDNIYIHHNVYEPELINRGEEFVEADAVLIVTHYENLS